MVITNDNLKPEKTYWYWVLGVGIVFFVMSIILSFIFWSIHDGFQEIPSHIRKDMPGFVFLMAAASTITVAIILRFFFVLYVIPLQNIVEDVEAMQQSSSRARLSTGKSTVELSRLEEALNELMHLNIDAEEEIEERIEKSLSALEEDRHWLELILEAPRHGVILCDDNGIVMKFNGAARKLLQEDHYLGQGRSLNWLIEESLLEFAKSSIKEQLSRQVDHPIVHLETEDTKGKLHQISVIPLVREPDASQALLLMLDDHQRKGVPPQPPHGIGITTGRKTAKDDVDVEKELLSALRYVVFDTETTGTHPSQGDEIISIGAVAIVDGRILQDETFDQLVKPHRKITEASIRIHGITPEKLVVMPRISEVLPDFARFAEGAVLLAHSAAFDMRFLKIKEEELGVRFDHPVLDTMLLSDVVHPNQESHSLDTLLERYGIEPSERHSALGDALMTAELFLRLLPLLNKKGINTLGEAFQASMESPLSRISF